MTVTNNEIVKRVMRFGIESKCGIPPEKWWETAKAQLVKEKQQYIQRLNTQYHKTLEDWFADNDQPKYMLVRGNHSRILRVNDPATLQKFKIVGWSSQYIPAVDELN